jgi:hypothetical protein
MKPVLANHRISRLSARRFPSAAGTVGAPTAVINGLTIQLPPQAIATGARKSPFCSHFIATDTIDLPRQARNKHMETLKQRGVFRRLCRLRPVGFEQCVSVHRGEKTALFVHVLYKNDRFTKTGSGQT